MSKWRARFAMAAAGVVLVGCGGDDPISAAADAICGAIDAEPDDAAAFEGYEQAVARERRAGLDVQELAAALEERCGRAISAIDIPADPAEPEPAPKPEPEPELVDLSQVDWAEQLWTTTCAVDGDLVFADDPLEVLLEVGDDGERFGWFHAHPDTPVPRYEIGLDEVTLGDVTGDGEEDAIFEAACIPGNVVQAGLVVWTLDAGQLVQLPEVWVRADGPAVVDAFEAAEGALRVATREPAPGAGPSGDYLVEVMTDWTFDGVTWMAQETARVDTSPPPAPPEPPSKPKPQPAPNSGACERLFGSGITGGYDDAYCQEVLDSLEECQRQMEADPEWVWRSAEGMWENTVTGDLQPPCDI
jgi:hypothetical protein